MARRRQDKFPDQIEVIAKLVGLVIVLLALSVGGVTHFTEAFTSLVTMILVLLFALIVIAGGIGIFLIKRRNRRLAGETGQSLSDLLDSIPASQPEPTLSEKLRQLDWFQFEKVSAAMLRARGFTVERRGGAKADGGIDLIARTETETIAVQCKHWQAWNVGVKTVREFLGAMTHAQITRGMIITLKGYTHDAALLAKNHNIELIDELQYLELLSDTGAQHDPEFQEALNDRTKYFPKCESPMVLRRGYNEFWGCSRFPQCRYTLKI